MNIWIFLLFISVGLITVGILVDKWYKHHGIMTDPTENQKHVNGSERAYAESMLDTMKNNHDNPLH